MNDWYIQLENVKLYLLDRDPTLKLLFSEVDNSGFLLHTVIKEPFTALICAIIGQKIKYTTARSLRAQLYESCGNNFTPMTLRGKDISFLGEKTSSIIVNVTDYIIDNNIDINAEDGIRSLINVKGIGQWTIETTLLTCLKNWNIFPVGDKFIQNRMKRLYGSDYNIKTITDKWSPFKSVVTWYLWRWF